MEPAIVFKDITATFATPLVQAGVREIMGFVKGVGFAIAIWDLRVTIAASIAVFETGEQLLGGCMASVIRVGVVFAMQDGADQIAIVTTCSRAVIEVRAVILPEFVSVKSSSKGQDAKCAMI